jgi:hypothetical protein
MTEARQIEAITKLTPANGVKCTDCEIDTLLDMWRLQRASLRLLASCIKDQVLRAMYEVRLEEREEVMRGIEQKAIALRRRRADA